MKKIKYVDSNRIRQTGHMIQSEKKASKQMRQLRKQRHNVWISK